MPLAGNNLEGVEDEFGGGFLFRLFPLRGIDALGEQGFCLVPPLPRHFQADGRVTAETQRVFLTRITVGQPPSLPSGGVHNQMQPTSVEMLVLLAVGFQICNAAICQAHCG